MKYFPPTQKNVDYQSIEIERMQNSPYIKTFSVHYKEAGRAKKWDIIRSMDGVAVVIFDKDKNSFVLVRQFRPAVFCNNKGLDGYTYELCAGLVDKEGKSLEEVASEEVLEECGYQVNPKSLHKIGAFFHSTGNNGSIQHLYFASVCAKDRVRSGGGIDEECLEVLYLPLGDSLTFIFDDTIPKTSSLFLGIQWYHFNKDKKI